jgi:hypothetical protein
MFDSLIGLASGNAGLLAGGGAGAVVLWVLKKVPNEKIASTVESCFYGLGKAITLGLSSWSVTKDFWNKVIEPWFIDLVDNTVGACVKGFIKGLRSDG